MNTGELRKSLKDLRVKFKAEVLQLFDVPLEKHVQFSSHQLIKNDILFYTPQTQPQKDFVKIELKKFNLISRNSHLIKSFTLPHLDKTIKRSFCLEEVPDKRCIYLNDLSPDNNIIIKCIDSGDMNIILSSSTETFKQVVSIFYQDDFIWVTDSFNKKVVKFTTDLNTVEIFSGWQEFESPAWVLPAGPNVYIGFNQSAFQQKYPAYSSGNVLSKSHVINMDKDSCTPIYPELDLCPQKIIKNAFILLPGDFIFAQTQNYLLKYDFNWQMVYQLNLNTLFQSHFPHMHMNDTGGIFSISHCGNKIAIVECQLIKKGILLEV